jgi:hypothetical protein
VDQAQQERPVIGRTKHTELTIDQIAEMQPGLGRIMPQVSDRYWVLYYAAKGGNWPLAAHQLNELTGLLRLGAVTRPQYQRHLDAFINGHLSAVRQAIEARDWPAFDRAYKKGIEGSNAYHRELGHPEIEWTLPPDPPRHLRLTPIESSSVP